MVHDWFELSENIVLDEETITAVEVQAEIEDCESSIKVLRVRTAVGTELPADDFDIGVDDLDMGTMEDILEAIKDDAVPYHRQGAL